MKILFLQDWNPLHGGAERYTLELRDAFADAGHEMRVLAADASTDAGELADYLAYSSDRALPKAILQLHNPMAAAAVSRAIEEFRPDVALVNMFALYLSPAALNALRAVPWLLLVSDYKITCPLGHRLLPDGSVCTFPRGRACSKQRCLPLPHWLREQLRYHLIDKAVSRAKAIISTSKHLQSILAEQGFESQCVPLFSTLSSSGAPRNPTDYPLFLYLGRLDVEKGVDDLLRAFARCRDSSPECQLRIVGRGAQRDELERLADELDLGHNVRFLGWKEPPELDAELARAWALVAPSRWPEPFGLVALEAIFRGVPALVPDQGGFRETVMHEKTGLKYPPGDLAALTAAMQRIATGEPFGSGGLNAEAVKRAQQQFSQHRHIASLQAVLSQHAVDGKR